MSHHFPSFAQLHRIAFVISYIASQPDPFSGDVVKQSRV
jgi:hypothetical protein